MFCLAKELGYLLNRRFLILFGFLTAWAFKPKTPDPPCFGREGEACSTDVVQSLLWIEYKPSGVGGELTTGERVGLYGAYQSSFTDRAITMYVMAHIIIGPAAPLNLNPIASNSIGPLVVRNSRTRLNEAIAHNGSPIIAAGCSYANVNAAELLTTSLAT